MNESSIVTYRSFIRMDMTSKDNIDFVLNEQRFIHHSHGLPFHIVMNITAIHGTVHEYD